MPSFSEAESSRFDDESAARAGNDAKTRVRAVAVIKMDQSFIKSVEFIMMFVSVLTL